MPSRVAISVMSVTYLRSGSRAVKSRSSRVFHTCRAVRSNSAKAAVFSAWTALTSLCGHQASNAFQADAFTFIEQILMHTRCADQAAAVLVNITNAPYQARVLLGA